MSKNVVYTSIDDFKLKNLEVRRYNALEEEFSEWIEEKTIELLQKRNKAEIMAGEELKKNYALVYEQPFFMIRGRSYFLDYYIPKYKLAVEIDGRYHRTRKLEDKQRDKDFAGIGIKTVRVRVKDVFAGLLMKRIRCFGNKNKKKRKFGTERPVNRATGR